MIAYHILCHDNFPQVARLVESLYSEDDIFLIDIDDGKKPNTDAIKNWCKRGNVHVTRDSNIGWGGSGTLRKTMRGAFKLLELDAKWSYYVVLSGQDLPLKSNAHIKSELARGAKQRTNFIRCFEAEYLALDSLEIDNKTAKSRMWGDRGHTKVFAKPGAINPQVGMYARTLVDVAEAGEDGVVYVGTVDPLLHRHREAFFKRYPFYTGANWFNLHRELIESMFGDPFTYELYAEIKTTFIPDESFFQTYIMNSRFRTSVSQAYGRLILRPGPIPRVKTFEMEDWNTIKTCKELYGRKFNTNHDSEIVNRVLAARAESEDVAASLRSREASATPENASGDAVSAGGKTSQQRADEVAGDLVKSA